jgi:coenzyme F420-reducing hydrogenase beta subunit
LPLAFRAVQKDLDLEEVFVLGTNCADNSPTREAANNFIENGVKVRGTEVQGYEFMQDFKVHVKTSDSYITKPYFTLPGTIAKSSIANSCLACFDYTNGLADVVVGYMGAPLEPNSRMNEAYQTVTIRNERGAKMVQVAVDASKLRVEKEVFGEGSHEQFATATVTSDSIVMEMIGKEPPEKGMPLFLGEIMAFVMRNVGPKGTNFARYSIDYHLLRNYLHILDEWGERRANQAVPEYVRNIVSQYMEIDPKFRDLVVQIGNKVK